MSVKVDDLSADYKEMTARYALSDCLMGGTTAMRAAGTKFLPQEAAESDTAYKARVARSFLFGGFERTVEILTGEVFRKGIVLSDDIPDRITEIKDNIDLQGNDITQFSKSCFRKVLTHGLGFILVDTPPLPKDEAGNPVPNTRKQDKKSGRRVYWVDLSARDVIGGIVEIVNGRTIFKQVRIWETVTERDGDFGVVGIEQIRVLEPGTWAVYRETSDSQSTEWVLFDEGTTELDYIPIVSFYFGRKEGPFLAYPPLTGLAELNQAHWISSSDQNNILHVSRVPFLFGKMLDTDNSGKVKVSANSLFHSNNPDSDLKFVEHSGAALGAGWKDLERLEMLMSLWGLELVSDARSGSVTATEKVLTQSKSGSFLNAIALTWQDALNTALTITCDILKIEAVGMMQVNTDFSLALSNFDSRIILEGFQIGLIDRGTAIDELKRRGILGENVDLTEVLAAIENDARAQSSFGSLGSNLLR